VKRILIVGVIIALAVLGFAISERQYIRRYLTFAGDPMVVPLQWYQPTDTVPGRPSDDLPVALPPRRTIHGDALARAADFAQAQNSQALIVVHRGVIQLEQYWQGAERSTRFNPQSMSKSVLGLLLGIAISEGHITSVEDPVDRYIDEWADDPRGAITIRQALGMAAGLERLASSDQNRFFSRGSRYNFGDDFEGVILEMALRDAPGTRFQYNNEETNLLGIVIQRATGQRYAEYLSAKLWRPLGLAEASMYLDRDGGSVMKSCCIFSRPYDWAKLGQLLLQGGRYGSDQIVSADWIDAMITPSPLVDHYGFKVWLGDGYIQPGESAPAGSDGAIAPGGYLADDMVVFLGYGGQRVWISRRYQLVIVRSTVRWPEAWVETRIPNLLIAGITNSADTSTQ
jgi:CubicO group peptidase (beta-lactamase class C family)